MVEKLEHTVGEAVKENEVAGTCIAHGSYDEVVRCTVCNEVLGRKTVTTDLGNHNPIVDEAVVASCTEKGKTKGSHCSICNKVLVEQKEIRK